MALHLDHALFSTPVSLHHIVSQTTSILPEWAWLASFCTAIKSATSLIEQQAFPEEFVVPNLEQGAAGGEEEQEEEEVVKGGWNLTMDAQVMAWATHQPEVAVKFLSA